MVLLPLRIVPVSQVDAAMILSLNSSGFVPDTVAALFRTICDVAASIDSIVAPAAMPGPVTISPWTSFARSWAETVTTGDPAAVVPDASQ